MLGFDQHGLSSRSDDPTVNPWQAQGDTRVVDEVANFEVVGAIEDDVDPFEQLANVRVGHIGHDGIEMGGRVDCRKMRCGGHRLRRVVFRIVEGVEGLAWQVIEFDPIAIDQP